MVETDTSDPNKEVPQVATEYVVRVGGEDITNGDKKYYEATISVLATPENEEPSVTVLWGDVNLSGTVDANDAGAVLKALAGGLKVYGDYTIGEALVGTTIWGDVNASSVVDANDAGAVLKALAGGLKVYGNYTIGEEALIK